MYLNIGQDTVISDKNILGIFDLDNTTVSKSTREYINTASKNGECITVSIEELPKSFIVVAEKDKTPEQGLICSGGRIRDIAL